MHLPAALYLLGLSSIAFTAPAPTAPVLNTDLHIIQLSNHWPVYPGSSLARRQGLCNWDGYCKSAYYGCIKICASLTNGDW